MCLFFGILFFAIGEIIELLEKNNELLYKNHNHLEDIQDFKQHLIKINENLNNIADNTKKDEESSKTQ